MGKPLSMDLRERVVGAISGGTSRRAAPSRFKGERGKRGEVDSASARPSQARSQAAGRRHKCSATAEFEAVRIWALYEVAPNITLAVLRAALATEGASIAVSTLDASSRVTTTRAKRPAMRKSRIDPTIRRGDVVILKSALALN